MFPPTRRAVFQNQQTEKDTRKVLANGAKRYPELVQTREDKSNRTRCPNIFEKRWHEAKAGPKSHQSSRNDVLEVE